MKDTDTLIAVIIATFGVVFLTAVSLDEIIKSKRYRFFILSLWMMSIFTWIASHTLGII